MYLIQRDDRAWHKGYNGNSNVDEFVSVRNKSRAIQHTTWSECYNILYRIMREQPKRFFRIVEVK